MELTYHLDGLDCPNCAAKIERAVSKINGADSVQVDYLNQKLVLSCEESQAKEISAATAAVVAKTEPDVTLRSWADGNKNTAHSHESKAQIDKAAIAKIAVSLIGLLVLNFIPILGWLRVVGYLAIYLLIGGDVVKKAVLNIFQGQVFDENFLMTIATVGAFAIGEYPEAVAVMLFYQIGEFFQDYAVDRSRKNIKELMDVRPDVARLVMDGQSQLVDPATVVPGQIVQVNPGEKIPLDGVIKEGKSFVDTAALTGESVPVKKESGDEVLSGCINQEQPLMIEVTKSFGQSTVNKILDLVENASSQKAPAEKFITKFARYYTPVVVLLAVALVAIPVVFFQGNFHDWLYRGLTFLVISCPCALVISVPLSFFAGIGGASRIGILIKGANHLESLAQVDTVVFDKTGTLTEGKFAVTKVVSEIPQTEFMAIAASMEQHSSHPIARSILSAYGQGSLLPVNDLQEIAGIGLQGKINGKSILVGNQKVFATAKLPVVKAAATGTVVYVIQEQQYLGQIVISDQIKADSAEAMKKLRGLGINNLVMLTGDSPIVAQKVAKTLGLDNFFASLLPGDKVAHLEEIKAGAKGQVAFVGDGINDAPVLVTADIGVAMGGLGSDAAIEAADVVIMNDQMTKLALAIRGAKKTLGIVKQNIIFALLVKVIVLILGALGFVAMGWAVFADVGVTLIAVLNAMRALKKMNN